MSPQGQVFSFYMIGLVAGGFMQVLGDKGFIVFQFIGEYRSRLCVFEGFYDSIQSIIVPFPDVETDGLLGFSFHCIGEPSGLAFSSDEKP